MDNYLEQYISGHLIRQSQQILMDEYHPADEMKCPIHFCKGQELVPALLGHYLVQSDYILSHHRSHGYYLAKGGDINAMVAEFYGKKSGANGGIAGSQELSYEPANFYSGTILAGMFAMANGVAFAHKYGKTGSVAVAVIGDGGMEEGICWEAINLAAVMNLPVIFIIENNQYSVHTSFSKRSKIDNLSKRVESFGVEAKRFSALDIGGINNYLKDKISAARNNYTPACIEIDVWRYAPHVGPENDDEKYNYRDKEAMKYWEANDPLLLMRKLLLDAGVKEDLISDSEAKNVNLVHEALSKAKADEYPSFEEANLHNLRGTKSQILQTISQYTIGRSFELNQQDTKLAPY